MEGQEQVQDMGQLIGLLEVAAGAAGEPGMRGKQIDQNFNMDVVITR